MSALVTEEMVTRALDAIMTPPGLWYFDDPDSMVHNREITRKALEAALGGSVMDDWTALDAKTWPQLRECTYLAVAALKKTDSDEARAALAAIEEVLTEGAHLGRPDGPSASSHD